MVAVWVVLGVTKEAWNRIPAAEKKKIRAKAALGYKGLAKILFNKAKKGKGKKQGKRVKAAKKISKQVREGFPL